MAETKILNVQETEESRAMIECYVENSSWQQALCFSLAVEHNGPNRQKLLFAMIGGADVTMQLLKQPLIQVGVH